MRPISALLQSCMADITPVLRRPDLVSEERLRRNIVDCLQSDAYCGPSVEKITQVTTGSGEFTLPLRS